MTDIAGTMRVIPTTVSAGAIGISDTTGINRQNRKNSYTRPNPQTLPRPRSVELEYFPRSGGDQRVLLVSAFVAEDDPNNSMHCIEPRGRSRPVTVACSYAASPRSRLAIQHFSTSAVLERCLHDLSGCWRSDLGDQQPFADSSVARALTELATLLFR
jgi:hypothetical protein